MILYKTLLSDEDAKEIRFFYKYLLLIMSLSTIIIYFVFIFFLDYIEMRKFDNFVEVDIEYIEDPVVLRFRRFFYIKTLYKYTYFNREYEGRRVGFGYAYQDGKNAFLSYEQKEMIKIRESIYKEKKGYIDPCNPSYSVLITKDRHLETQDLYRGNLYIFFSITIFFLWIFLIFSANYLIYDKPKINLKTKIDKCGLKTRFLSLVSDFFSYTSFFMPIIILTYEGNYYCFCSDNSGVVDFLFKYSFIVILFFSWVLYQRTPGQFLFNLKIVDTKTLGKPSVFQIILRMLGCVLSILPLFLGFIWVIFDKNQQGWHDKISGTCVVTVHEEEEDVTQEVEEV